jgi:Dolichyl-phosphate-mannose-protein mannosyltransferase
MKRTRSFLALLVALVLGGILRSAVATRLDSFHLDEGYHITAGVTYARLGDYRLNPEHPPLMKLWAGMFLTPNIFKTPQFRPLSEKWDERHFTEEVVFTDNDPDVAQHRTRIAMFILNGLLLLGFALAVWRAFGSKVGPVMAVGALAFLIIDPTIAAHLPVALTDLPIALLGSTAVLLAWAAFRWGRLLDVLSASLALGLAIGAKHTGLIVVVSVALLGAVMLLRKQEHRPRLRRLGQVFAVLVLAWVTLWGLYRFRFNESPVGLDQFNRPLATKIADLHSPLLRNTVSLMVRTHFMPRSYLWGLADILHVGVEGRVFPLFFLGHTYLERAPFYFFPTVLLVKLPLGLIALPLAGLVLILNDRTWSGKEPLLVILLFGALLLLMLIRGTSSYAGIRHGQIVIPPLAVLAAAGLSVAWEHRSRVVLVGLGIAALAAMVSGIPVMRPWLYYNETIGTDNAWRYFSDEGTDFGQRTKEIAAYYHHKLEPQGEIPYLEYLESYAEDDRRGIRSLQAEWKRHPETDTSNVVSGVFMIPATVLLSDPVIDYSPFLAATPIDRFGVMLVYRGTFNLPGPRASRFDTRAMDAEYSSQPDLTKAAAYLSKSLEILPNVYYRWIELGNIQLQRGLRDEALHAYENALKYVPAGNEMGGLIAEQIRRVSKEDLKSVPTLRNPILE